MKKWFILFICFVTLFISTGCNSENYNDYKINIKFILGARTETVIKEQDEIILIDDIKEVVCFNLFQIGELVNGFSIELIKDNAGNINIFDV